MHLLQAVDWFKDQYGLPDLYVKTAVLVGQTPVDLTGKAWLGEASWKLVLTAHWTFSAF